MTERIGRLSRGSQATKCRFEIRADCHAVQLAKSWWAAPSTPVRKQVAHSLKALPQGADRIWNQPWLIASSIDPSLVAEFSRSGYNKEIYRIKLREGYEQLELTKTSRAHIET